MEQDNELLLFDRINAIKDTIKKYGEENFYLSFSGGKDSTVLHYLLDMALPNNKIPRVFINTGIEYLKIVEFVKRFAKNDDRFVLLAPSVKPKEMLEKYGYPFKSKQHAHNWEVFFHNRKEFFEISKKIDANPELLFDYNFIHNLPKGLKTVVKYYYGVREKVNPNGGGYKIFTSIKSVPNILEYQFKEGFNLKLSDQCCYRMKKLPVKEWQKKSGKSITITGMRAEEGGMRTQLNCITTSGNSISKFHPLVKVNDEWEDWFIKEYNINLCDLYKAPYNFRRSGCRFCPFSLDLQHQMEVASELMPADKIAGEMLWKPVFDEYRRIGYRLSNQMSIFDK